MNSLIRHVARAVLEGIAHQAKEVTVCMAADTGAALTGLRVDGGGEKGGGDGGGKKGGGAGNALTTNETCSGDS